MLTEKWDRRLRHEAGRDRHPLDVSLIGGQISSVATAIRHPGIPAASPKREPAMIYEFRSYTLKPRSLAEVEKRYAEAYEHWHRLLGSWAASIRVWETMSRGRGPRGGPAAGGRSS